MSEPFIGQIIMFAGNFAPRSWAFCNGQLLPIPQNTALFSLLGTTYGGDGRTTFALPDLRGRLPMHAGNGPGLTPRRLGEKGGTREVTLTETQIPSHSHPVSIGVSADPASSSKPVGRVPAVPGDGSSPYAPAPGQNPVGDSTLADTGGDQAHPNIMPSQGVNFIIALQGIYPSRS